MYSSRASVTVAFFVRCPPTRRASSSRRSSIARLVGMCNILHMVGGETSGSIRRLGRVEAAEVVELRHGRRTRRLRVWGDRDDRDHALLGTVVPENTIRRRRTMLGVGLENLLAACAFQARVLVRLEARVARVCLQQTERFPHRLAALRATRFALQVCEIGSRLVGEPQPEA